MKSVILFGGGDAGGLIITANGVRRIPPFDPGILKALKATASLVAAAKAASSEKAREKLGRLATSLSVAALEQVEDVVGPLEGESALVFQDEGDGFTCGTTGKKPIPLPWPPADLPSIGDMVETGVVGSDMVGFLREVREQKIAFADAVENPKAVAEKLGVSLSERSAQDLQLIAPSRLDAVRDPTEREVLSFFHKVAADGRHLDSWYSRPYEVSKDLGVKLSDAALDRLVSKGVASAFEETASEGGTAIAVGIGWAVVCIVVGIVLGDVERPIDVIVQDRSGRATI